MNEITLKELTEAIRNGSSNSELMKMIGATDEEETRQRERLAELDKIDMRENNPHRWDRLMAECDRFEFDYC